MVERTRIDKSGIAVCANTVFGLCRYYGRKIIFMLLPHPEFDRVLRQHIQPNTLRNIQDILEGLKSKVSVKFSIPNCVGKMCSVLY